MTYNLHNRRYIGNKFKLLPFIDSVVSSEHLSFNTVADVFAGTGVVAEHFMQNNKKVIVNDNLYSNYVFYQAWLSNAEYDKTKIEKTLYYFNSSKEFLHDNYFSDTFSHTYYSYEDAKRIGSIRDCLEQLKPTLTLREYYILLSSLLYTADKIANTVGHFEAFLGKKPIDKGVILEPLNIKQYARTAKIYKENANQLITSISSDLLYLDPPYNARQYANFYHLLENLAEWNKPKVKGKTLKMPRADKMSKYSTSSAKESLEELISFAKTKYILLSYNNTYKANSGASINKISEEDILSILSKVGEVKKFDINYPFFNSGKTNFNNHKEILYLCKL